MLLEVIGIIAVGGLAYGLFKSGKKGDQPTNDSENRDKGEPYLSQYLTFGNHLYRQKGEVSKVVLRNPKKHIVRTIIEDDGRINGFPGFEHSELIASYLDDVSDKPYVRFRSEFEKTENGFMFCWQIQPDGRYWEDDDGFGSESGAELILYAYLNDEGVFTSKFKIYSYGVTKYYNTDMEDAAAQKLKER